MWYYLGDFAFLILGRFGSESSDNCTSMLGTRSIIGALTESREDSLWINQIISCNHKVPEMEFYSEKWTISYPKVVIRILILYIPFNDITLILNSVCHHVQLKCAPPPIYLVYLPFAWLHKVKIHIATGLYIVIYPLLCG